MADPTLLPTQSFEINMREEDHELSDKEKEILKSLEEASYKTHSTPLIRRVTHILRENEAFTKYFIPNLVTIGPIHHDDSPGSKYEDAEMAKRSLTARFLKKSGGTTTKEVLYKNVKNKLETLKGFYDPKEMKKWEKRDEDLALMFLVDGCAVLHFIFLDSNDSLKEIGFKNDLLVFTKHDLFLLENQLPYKLLEILMNSCSEERANELRKSITKFIHSNAMISADVSWEENGNEKEEKENEMPKRQKEEKTQNKPPHHLLGMLRERLIGKPKNKRGSKLQRILDHILCGQGKASQIQYGHTFRGAHELKQKGIMVGVSDTCSLEDISLGRQIRSFCTATLRLPPMIVDDSTGPKFVNLIAYEMCPDFLNDFEITSYISFLDSLIDKEEDVRELRDVGVLHNGLGSDQVVADLFNKIGINLVPNPAAYKGVKTRIQEHCNSAWATEGSQLYYTYFNSPWSFLAFVGALIGLGLTAAQTYVDLFGLGR